jgi:hypothetical protein
LTQNMVFLGQFVGFSKRLLNRLGRGVGKHAAILDRRDTQRSSIWRPPIDNSQAQQFLPSIL